MNGMTICKTTLSVEEKSNNISKTSILLWKKFMSFVTKKCLKNGRIALLKGFMHCDQPDSLPLSLRLCCHNE